MIFVGLSHRQAPIEIRERLALGADGARHVLEQTAGLSGVSEALVLGTCNRVEIYAVARSTEDAEPSAIEGIVDLLASRGGQDVARYLRTASGPAAIEHLFHVAASLDSLVVGERQILGQLKAAVAVAKEAGTLGPILGSATTAAIRTGKRVMAETTLGAGRVSVPSVAVDLARQIFDDLDGRTALLLGAGEMAESAARSLTKAGASVWVVNRSLERAERLANLVGGRAAPWERLDACLARADVVVTSTSSPQPLITPARLAEVMPSRRGRSLFFVDIAVPRDVDPAVDRFEEVFLYDIDDLSRVVAAGLADREAASTAAERLVRAELEEFERHHQERQLTPIIVGLRQHAQQILMAELDRSLKGKLKHLSKAERKSLRKMMAAATNKLLHTPTTRLKELATGPDGAVYADAVSELFGLDCAPRRPEVEAVREEAEVGPAGSRTECSVSSLSVARMVPVRGTGV